jgi:hypothetical protein
MRLTVILSDAAQTVDGKLYVLGGGWTQASGATPLHVALGIVAAVPWEDANRQHPVLVQLIREDGEPVEQDGGPVQAEGQFEIGRPPGIKEGSDLNATMVLKFNGLDLRPGGYVFQVQVGDAVERTPFWVEGDAT